MAMGFGITNLAVLRKLSSSPDDPSGDTTPGAAPDGGQATASVATPTSSAPVEPVAVPVVDAARAPESLPADTVFDVAINGGRLIDPASGLDAVASIGVTAGTVTAVFVQNDPAEPLPTLGATTVIDARGLVVAPGFIDILSYSPNGYGEWYKVADGVTSNLGMHGLDSRAGPWFEARPDGSSPVHFGGAYDNATVRANLGLEPYDSADTPTLEQMVAAAGSDLANGFLGLHMQPEYTPGANSAELLAHARLAAQVGVPLCVHARYSDNLAPGTNLEAISELVNAAQQTGAHVHIEHINSTGGTGVMTEALAMIDTAIGQGAKLTACMYPYTFWATYLRSARFDDWQRKYGISYGDLQVAGTSQRLTEATFAQAFADNALTAAFAIPEADIETALRADFVMVGSDAILERSHRNHPRCAGCFSRVLGRYVRDLGVIDLPTALSKMTIQPARLLEGRCPDLRRKGRLGLGADADICVFDPATVADQATIENPAQKSVGINWVIVEGKVMQSPTGAAPETAVLPGRSLRSDVVV